MLPRLSWRTVGAMFNVMTPCFGQSGARFFLAVLPLALILVLASGGNIRAQQRDLALAQRHALTLEAHSVANGGRSDVTGGSNGLPLTNTISVQSVGDRRVSSNQTSIEISVRNLAPTPDRVRVEWFFVALPAGSPAAGGQAQEIIFHHDAQLLAIPGGKTATQVVDSPETRAVYERSTTVTNIPANVSTTGYGSTTVAVVNSQTGLVPRGWMVRLLTPEGIALASKGSNQTYENIAADPARLAKMLARSRPADPGGQR